MRRVGWFEGDPMPVGYDLVDGSRIAIIGGGPAGALAALFASRIAEYSGISLDIEIFEPRSFERGGPAGCNHCGGIVSESLVQTLAADGINLPPGIVQRGIESYRLHVDLGSVEVSSPLAESRIAAVYRGNGPRNSEGLSGESFDGFLLGLAVGKGARVRRSLVTALEWRDDRPYVRLMDGLDGPYDLVVVAAGVNSNLIRSLDLAGDGSAAPETARTYICEFRSDRETIRSKLGNSMHVFMLDMPGVEFAALIPKGDYITFAVLGDGIDSDVIERFLMLDQVRQALPFDWIPCVCSCTPLINLKGSGRPFGDRVVMIGDSGVTRLYKDGIGAAYRTAKAAMTAALLFGVSATSFGRHYEPVCRNIRRDNGYGRALFSLTSLFRMVPVLRRAVLRMTRAEQASTAGTGPMSRILWNLFTGSAPYREVFWAALRPGFLVRFAFCTVMSLVPSRSEREGRQRAEATV